MRVGKDQLLEGLPALIAAVFIDRHGWMFARSGSWVKRQERERLSAVIEASNTWASRSGTPASG